MLPLQCTGTYLVQYIKTPLVVWLYVEGKVVVVPSKVFWWDQLRADSAVCLFF
jgi:hypothetical protein